MKMTSAAPSGKREIVADRKHDPFRAHELIKTFCDWDSVAVRTEAVYEAVFKSPQMELWERMKRTMQLEVLSAFRRVNEQLRNSDARQMPRFREEVAQRQEFDAFANWVQGGPRLR
ncbi:hypothetical protein C8F04DRAFT_1261220 [Mycena alexandri]|uniref:Uncharacterized protein n=1 Tax=Mycena alexandri TaxID=1745969 RepID=A0AAD6X2C4_9AGAR|nr:hypothetical protein C8F04DRAFT_1261220 [Mycena alexandri]